ncbi:flavin reductase [Paraburkholderia caffeinilytica]|nr:flavin reductase [Paraburkholderia caffeinilytica]CAB3779966.1 p-hydroxyphenylacetate 3-hydroxylase, reductase component [Paraburkholderia caffeinilytica]
MAELSSFDTTEFRKTLATFVTGVTIITTCTESGERVGLTANSFNTVSLSPPLVLWSLAKTSRNIDAFSRAGHWAVHILAADQQDLSNRFAKSGHDKFAGVETDAGTGGVPLLRGCASRLQCRTSFRYDGGDHLILVGEVLDFDRSEHPPLVFHGGSYGLALKNLKLPPRDTDETSAEGPASFKEDFLDYLLPRAHYQIYSRIRAAHASHGLSDSEFFVLSSLVAQDGRTLSEIDAMFSVTGHCVTSDTVQSLAGRHLVHYTTPATDAMAARLTLTPEGRETTLRVMAAAKAIEAEIFAQLGYWESVCLKLLLRQVVAMTDIGLPAMWAAPA